MLSTRIGLLDHISHEADRAYTAHAAQQTPTLLCKEGFSIYHIYKRKNSFCGRKWVRPALCQEGVARQKNTPFAGVICARAPHISCGERH